MHRSDFVASVRRAETDAQDAAAVRDSMRLWSDRLAPYLEGDPDLTIADALERYRLDHAPARTRPNG